MSQFFFWLLSLYQELGDVIKLFELLKQKNEDQTAQGEAGKRLKDIVEQAEKMKSEVEDKHTRIQGSIKALFVLHYHHDSYSGNRRSNQCKLCYSSSMCNSTEWCRSLCILCLRTGGQDTSTHQEKGGQSSWSVHAVGDGGLTSKGTHQTRWRIQKLYFINTAE